MGEAGCDGGYGLSEVGGIRMRKLIPKEGVAI